jgi:hypothetical protein
MQANILFYFIKYCEWFRFILFSLCLTLNLKKNICTTSSSLGLTRPITFQAGTNDSNMISKAMIIPVNTQVIICLKRMIRINLFLFFFSFLFFFFFKKKKQVS